jgi:hypothetical protein
LEKKFSTNRYDGQIYRFLADKLAPCKMAVGENDIHTFERNI